MDKNIIFRLGKYVVHGVVKEAKDKLLSVEARAVHVTKDQWKPVKPEMMEVSPAFVMTDEYDPGAMRFVEARVITTVESLVRESIVPTLGFGNVQYGYSELVGYGDGVWFNENGQDTDKINPEDILSNVQLGQFLALEGLRPKLQKLGLVDLNKMETVSEGFVSLKEGINVFMKVEPFRDVTRIHEGTMTATLGYYKGCVVVEADGEIFWRPIEENTFWDKKVKDKEYYFSFDSNGDLVPDPVQALPSKVAHNTTKPSRGEDNWNSSPKLPKVAGHLAAIPEIDMSDFTILGESYVSNYYNDDERLAGADNAEYDNEVEPGLEPTDMDDPDDLDGDEEDAMEAIMKGADLDHVLSGDDGYERMFEEIYTREIDKTFPTAD